MVFLLNHLLHSSSPLLLDKVVANLKKLQIVGLAVSPCYFLLTGPSVFLQLVLPAPLLLTAGLHSSFTCFWYRSRGCTGSPLKPRRCFYCSLSELLKAILTVLANQQHRPTNLMLLARVSPLLILHQLGKNHPRICSPTMRLQHTSNKK